MKAKVVPVLIGCIFILHFSSLKGQTLSCDSLNIENIKDAATDIYGNLYLCDAKGQILKIEPAPLKIIRYSGRRTLSYDKIDAGSFNRIAVFSKDLQLVTLLDKNLAPIGNIPLNHGIASRAVSMCVGSDNSIWIYDEADASVKKIEPVTGRLLLDVGHALPQDSREILIMDMQEYQNRLYLLNRDSTIFIFDNMANYLKSVTKFAYPYLGFAGNNLVSVRNDSLVFTDLYSGITLEKELTETHTAGRVLITPDHLFCISENILIKTLKGDTSR